MWGQFDIWISTNQRCINGEIFDATSAGQNLPYFQWNFSGPRNVTSVEINVEYWNCRLNLCFLSNFQLKKKSALKEVQITLIKLWSFISFELWRLNSSKVPHNAKFGHSFFQVKIKRKRDQNLTPISTLPLWYDHLVYWIYIVFIKEICNVYFIYQTYSLLFFDHTSSL